MHLTDDVFKSLVMPARKDHFRYTGWADGHPVRSPLCVSNVTMASVPNSHHSLYDSYMQGNEMHICWCNANNYCYLFVISVY